MRSGRLLLAPRVVVVTLNIGTGERPYTNTDELLSQVAQVTRYSVLVEKGCEHVRVHLPRWLLMRHLHSPLGNFHLGRMQAVTTTACLLLCLMHYYVRTEYTKVPMRLGVASYSCNYSCNP